MTYYNEPELTCKTIDTGCKKLVEIQNLAYEIGRRTTSDTIIEWADEIQAITEEVDDVLEYCRRMNDELRGWTHDELGDHEQTIDNLGDDLRDARADIDRLTIDLRDAEYELNEREINE